MEFINYLKNRIDLDHQLDAGTFEGVISLMPNSRYHACEKYFSSSQLKYLSLKSPKHFYHKYVSREFRDDGPSDSMLLGSLSHAKLLEPNSYVDEFTVLPKVDGRTKEGKAIKEAALLSGKMVVSQDLDEMSTAIVHAICNHNPSRKLLENLTTEVAYFWKCKFTGLMFRAKIDGICDSYMMELKTTRSSSPVEFSRQAYNLNYDLSVSHYLKGCGDREVYFVAVESEAPWTVQCFKASDEFLEVGHNKWLDAVQKLERSLASNEWPGYVEDEVEPYPVLLPPAWAMKKQLEEVE